MFRLLTSIIACGLLNTACLKLPVACAAETSAAIAQELRVVWGGSSPRVFQGSLSIDEGSIKAIRNLSMQESAIGAIIQRDATTIELGSAGQTTFGGMDIAIRGAVNSKLRVRIQDGLSGKVFERSINLFELQQKNWIEPVDDSGSRIAIERQVHDRLRVETVNNDNSIFECGSIWTPSISGFRTGLATGEYHLIGSWAGRSNSHVIDTPIHVDEQGNFAAFKPELKIPANEGAHRLDLAIAKSNLISAISGSKPLLARSVELLAFNPNASVPTISGWHAVMAVDTAAAIKPEGLSWLTSFTGSLASRALVVPETLGLPSIDLGEQINKLIPFSKSVTNFGAISKGGQLSVRDYRIEGASSAQKTAVIGPSSWISLPLSGLQVGKAHRLRIQIPIDHPSCLSVSVRDGGSEAGESLLDPQVCVEIKKEECDSGATITQDFIFWPKSDSTSVLVASGSRSKTALVGKILVEAAEYSTRPANPVQNAENRDIAIYLDQPLLVDCFSAPREKDAVNGRWLESWRTWQAVAERIVLQMQLAGANTLVLTGVSNGNSIVTQHSPLPLHRLDKGTFFTDGRSPEMHDVVDLLLYHFDRAGLKLILEVEPSSSSQATASITADEIAQLDLLNLDGKTGARDVGAARLNPLNRKVEQANFEPIRELSRRYGRHLAFGGISLRLNPTSQYLYTGDRWGYNEELLKQFATESNLVIPKDSAQVSQLLAGPARFRFINWRAKQLTSSFGKMAQTLPNSNRDQKLYLNVMHLVSRAPSETDFVDPDTAGRNQLQLLQSYGIDSEVAALHKNLAIIQGVVRQSKQAVSSAEWFRNGWLESNEVLKNSYVQPSILITHQPKSMKLAGDAEKPKQAEMWIYPDAARCNKAAKQALLEQLWKQDPILLGAGGWHPVWSTDTEVQRLTESLRELPPVVMQDSGILPSDAPLKIRSTVFQNQAYVYVLNPSRWEIAVQLLTAKSPQGVEVIGSSNANLVDQTGTGLGLRIPACELIALRATDPKCLEIRSANYQLPDSSIESTVQRLEQFEALLARSADPGHQQVLFGLAGAFEQWNSANKPAGWNVSTLPNTFIQPATELPRSGNYSIQIENRNQEPATAWIQSAPIELPETGRLTLRAWLRASAADQAQPQVRLGLIGRFANGGRYQRSVIYGRGQSDPTRTLSIDWGRRPAELHVSDIPVDDLVELQVAIDLIGPGRIWVDDVEVVQSWLHPDERNYLRGQVLVVKEKLNAKNPFAADRLLNSPWSDYLFDLGNKASVGKTESVAAPAHDENRTDWNKTKPSLQQLRESMRQRWNR